MPDRLVFTAGAVKGGRTKVVVERHGAAGAVARSEQFFDADHHFVTAARLLGVTPQQLQALILKHRSSLPAEHALGPVEVVKLITYRLRGIKQRAGEATEHETFEAALAAVCSAEDPVIEWEGIDELCALDLDFHGADAPVEADLRAEAVLLEPRPGLWWVSRHGGLRAVFGRLGANTAEELAAIAGVQLLQRFPAAKLELKSRTRRPLADVVRQTPTADATYLRRFSSARSADAEVIAEWLETRGFEVGGRYPHARCPVNPGPRAQGNADPVCVYENHVFCHICSADGVRRGSRTCGYFPYAKLCGDAVPTQFANCVRHFTHWGHAQFVVSRVVDNLVLAKSVYRAALKQVHGDDPRVPIAFSAGGPVGLVRFDGFWGTSSGQPLKVDRTSPILAALPCAKYIDEGELKTSAETTEWLAQTCDLSPIGYPSIVPVWGVHMTRDQELPAHKLFVVMHSADLRHESMESRRPKYVPSGRRQDLEVAWCTLERAFPKLNRNAIILLLVAKGCSEYRAGLPPMVFFTGPTGSGKTASVKLAAAICGDHATTVPFSPQPERVRMGLLAAKQQGSFAAFDEFIKGAKAAKQRADDAMEILLGFTPDSVSHMLYVGPVPLGELPVCYWADTMIPAEVLTHSQIGRRVHHVSQQGEMAWEPSLKAAGIDGPDGLRTTGSKEYVDAADAILSYVIDEFFPPGPPTDFADAAERLGFKKLRDSNLAAEKVALVRRLFKLVCMAPPLDGADKRRWPGTGWKLVDMARGDGELVETWRWLADPGDQTVSRAVAECDLRSILGLSHVAQLDHRSHGARVVLRFANDDLELYNDSLVLEPEGSRPDGRGDAECGRPPQDWLSRLPAGFVDPPAVCSLPDGEHADHVDSGEPSAA